MWSRGPGPYLVAASLILASCGEFVGFRTSTNQDIGNLSRFDIYIGEDELAVLYDSVTYSNYAVCRFDDGSMISNADIRIRGNYSRLNAKKSFTLRYTDEDGEEIKVALDGGGDSWFGYKLAMYAYERVGLPVPQLEPIGLFLNNEYLGYYNRLPLYSEELDDHYGGSGQLFKILYMSDSPIRGRSEKKFPDDDDFSLLERLEANSRNMPTSQWVPWIEENVDLEDMARYMVVLDFFGVSNLSFSNYYIYFNNGARVLPWDHDHSYSYSEIGGNNRLTSRMLESSVFQDYYRDYFNQYFLDAGSENIVADLQSELADLAALLDAAAQIEPVYNIDYDDFLIEWAFIDTFLADRPTDIDTDPDWSAFFNG